MSEHPADESGPDDAVRGDAGRDRSGSAAARGAWMASGITFFAVGVVFTLTMPDNIALGITFLGLGVVFFSLAGSQRAPGDGPGRSSSDVTPDAGASPAASPPLPTTSASPDASLPAASPPLALSSPPSLSVPPAPSSPSAPPALEPPPA